MEETGTIGHPRTVLPLLAVARDLDGRRIVPQILRAPDLVGHRPQRLRQRAGRIQLRPIVLRMQEQGQGSRRHSQLSRGQQILRRRSRHDPEIRGVQ